jgi:hypothetical protein
MDQKDVELPKKETDSMNDEFHETAIRIRSTQSSGNLATQINLIQRVVTGALGSMSLLAEYDGQAVLQRCLRLEASADGRSVLLVDQDHRRSGTQREVRYEITPAELIAVIRARGAKLPIEHRAVDGNEPPVFQHGTCVN